MKNTLVWCFGFAVLMTTLSRSNLVMGILVVLVFVGYFVLRRRVSTASGYTRVRGHSHRGPIANVSRHEGGHAAATEIVGGRVVDARVTGNDRYASGYTESVIPNDPASHIGVYLAGLQAAPGTSSPSDLRYVDQVLAGVPSPFRGRILSDGQQIARRAANSSRVKHYADKLERNGRL